MRPLSPLGVHSDGNESAIEVVGRDRSMQDLVAGGAKGCRFGNLSADPEEELE